MKRTRIKRKRIPEKKYAASCDPVVPQNNTDLTGTDDDADHTNNDTTEQIFGKPQREENPDKTGIDIQTEIQNTKA